MLFYEVFLLYISATLEGNKGRIYRDITILVLYIRAMIHKLISMYASFATHFSEEDFKIRRNM
jgi:hypothetical protein